MPPTPNDPLAGKQFLSIKEMAQRMHLSRSRIEQLLAAGVLVPPTRDERSGRPYFTPEAVAKNVEVRRTGVGIDGKPILFYSPRVRTLTGTPSHRKAKPSAATTGGSARVAELVTDLSDLDLGRVTTEEVERALRALVQQGHRDPDVRVVYREVKRHRGASDS